MIIIENKVLKLEIKEFGAELHSINYLGIERLHQDMNVWPRQSPVMFPMLSKTKDDFYLARGVKYDMPHPHGFARLSTFTVIKKTDTSCVLEFASNEDTLKMYPYNFKLNVYYGIKNNTITTKWVVTNNGSDNMYFTIGGHPGFNYNAGNNETYEDYILEFDKPIAYNTYVVNNGLLSDKTMKQEDLIKQLNIYKEIKKYNVVVFDSMKAATMKSTVSESFVRIEFPKMPYVAFWQTNMEKPPFLCLEPWCGLPDFADTDHVFETKRTNIELLPNKSYKNGYTIIIG